MKRGTALVVCTVSPPNAVGGMPEKVFILPYYGRLVRHIDLAVLTGLSLSEADTKILD